MAFDPLSPEVTYALKGNIAYPLSDRAASVLATAAGNRMQDAYVGTTITVAASDFKIANP